MLRRILSALFAITMLAAVGCGGGTSSAEVSLTGAVESLFAGPFAWTVTVEADRSSLNELGEGAREAADFLAGLRVSGVVDGNEAARLSISALGVDNIAELLFMGNEAMYVRASLSDFAAAVGEEPLDTDEILSGLAAANVDPGVIDAVTAFLQGNWVGLNGLEGVEDLAGGATGDEAFDLDEARTAIANAFGDSPEEFMERFVTFTESSDGDETRYDVTLDVAELVQAAMTLNEDLGVGSVPTEGVEELLGEMPSEIEGVVLVRDGVLSEIVVDLAEVARSAGQQANGSIMVRVTFDDDPPALSAPDSATVVTLEELGGAITSFLGFRAEDMFRELEEQLGELPTDFPTDFFSDFPTDFFSDFPTEFFSEFPTSFGQ